MGSCLLRGIVARGRPEDISVQRHVRGRVQLAPIRARDAALGAARAHQRINRQHYADNHDNIKAPHLHRMNPATQTKELIFISNHKIDKQL
jgi:hypothetical protein